MSSRQEVSYAVPNSAFKFEIIVCVPGTYSPVLAKHTKRFSLEDVPLSVWTGCIGTLNPCGSRRTKVPNKGLDGYVVSRSEGVTDDGAFTWIPLPIRHRLTIPLVTQGGGAFARSTHPQLDQAPGDSVRWQDYALEPSDRLGRS